MNQIRKRITYANVMSSIAVFLVLGGATALAAAQLGKNSVGAKQLKKNAVTTAKIKKNAVTAAKIKDGAVTGAKINLGTVGTVPSAQNAENANSVDGQSAHKIFKTLTEGQTGIAVGTVAGFNIVASCNANDADVTITAPTGQGSVLTSAGGADNSATTFDYDADANGGSIIQIDTRVGGGDTTYGVSSVTGSLSGGTTISGVIGYDWDTFNDTPPGTCIVNGHLLAG